MSADVGTKKGEKVDDAIKDGESVIILIECKKAREPLNENHLGQLFRYFAVTPARIALLTSGFVYRFYSDLEDRNKMDRIPFLEIDLRNLKELHLRELEKLSKEAFNLRRRAPGGGPALRRVDRRYRPEPIVSAGR